MIAEIVAATVYVLTFAIIGRALLSWFNPNPHNPLVEFLVTVTEPILAPLRAIMPRMGMIDLTPMVAIILLQVVRRILLQNLS